MHTDWLQDRGTGMERWNNARGECPRITETPKSNMTQSGSDILRQV